jgi:hypothetical protein
MLRSVSANVRKVLKVRAGVSVCAELEACVSAQWAVFDPKHG